MDAGFPPVAGLVERLRAVSSAEPVALAYLFGSAARGTTDQESDIDVAILTDQSLGKEDRQELRLRLMRSFGDALGVPTDRLDVIALQDVPTLLQYNAIRVGSLVYERMPGTAKGFEFSVERRYDDESPLLDRDADLTIDRILSRSA
jgi:uncharacterized protein